LAALDVIEKEHLLENSASVGDHMLKRQGGHRRTCRCALPDNDCLRRQIAARTPKEPTLIAG
jgi:hypothetical protein